MFNGVTLKKIFGFDNDSKSNTNVESTESLAKHVEQLKQTIESSKVFMRAIIDKIRHQGKIKIINKLNKNPRHPEYQSSFPDLFHDTPKPNNQDTFYPFNRLDENFDLQGRKDILKIDKHFKERMNKSIQEDYSDDFLDNYKWKVSDQVNSFKNIKYTIEHFQNKFNHLKYFDILDETFMSDTHPSLFIINNNVLSIDSSEKMIEEFKKQIPNIEDQKLISTYANEKFLHQSYLQLLTENPAIDQYQIQHSRNIYKINYLSDGSIKLVSTNISDLHVKNDNCIQKYKSFGIRATIIMSPNKLPIIKYSHFIM